MEKKTEAKKEVYEIHRDLIYKITAMKTQEHHLGVTERSYIGGYSGQVT